VVDLLRCALTGADAGRHAQPVVGRAGPRDPWGQRPPDVCDAVEVPDLELGERSRPPLDEDLVGGRS